jgi:hypothetical protein
MQKWFKDIKNVQNTLKCVKRDEKMCKKVEMLEKKFGTLFIYNLMYIKVGKCYNNVELIH